jgi:hypothetical protein
MAGFITDAALNTAVQNALAKTEPLAAFWATVITQANAMAYGDIAGALTERGFNQAQILAWDRGVEFQTALGIFWALDQAAMKDPETYSKTAMKEYDRRDELRGNPAKNILPVAVLNGGVWQDPATTVGQAVTGHVQGYPHTSQPSGSSPGFGRDEWKHEGW